MDPSLKKRKTEENGTVAADGVTALITPEDLGKILEPFTQEQLVDIVKVAASRNLEVLESVRAIADRDPAQRKLFIRGLGWDTTTDGLRTLFSAYGELEEAVVILDKQTGKSKGFGFITFKHIDGAMLALKEPSKRIDGRMTVTQLASAGISGGPTASFSAVDVGSRKIYVGNVPPDMPADRLLVHFLAYGEIEEGPLGFDKQTGKSRGFALFVYKTSEAARASLVDPIKTIDGHQMTCKLAIDGKKRPGEVPADPMQPPTSMPMPSQYPTPGAPIPPYGSYPSVHQAQVGLLHHQMPPSLHSSIATQPPSLSGVAGTGYGTGLSNNPYAGPPPSAYGGLAASSLYRLPPGSVGLPSSYPEAGPYGLSSSPYPGQLPQQSTPSTAPRMPPGAGLYPTMPHYY